ncbi:hypothetical protein FACS189487_07440 [Campylobacterota bacterium]|nr:hypothetical protein FACS189487_07440 [Campylobacterota bacterium]
MSFWQELAYSYDRNADELKSLFPLSTTSISNRTDMIAVISIRENGELIRVDKIEKRNKSNAAISITMPVSEKSLARSSDVSPHPVFDQYEYLKGKGKKFDDYLGKLEKFANSEFATDQIKAIYNYVSKKSVAKDLENSGVKDKTNIIFEVQIPKKEQFKVWLDDAFFEAWHNYYMAQKDSSKTLDYISGEVQLTADSHPKKISNTSANSKLISDNDNKNYTFRGKFNNSNEALSLGYISSQKAHQFLRYLISDRGVYCDEQVILSYAIGKTRKLPAPLNDTKSVFGDVCDETQTDSDKKIALLARTGNDYSEALQQALAGYDSKSLYKHDKTAVIVLDAATTGRLSVTFYRELIESEYLEKIADWHNSCKWHQVSWDKEKKPHKFIGAPSVDRIIEAIHGKPRGNDDKSYKKLKKAARERLIHCIFDGDRLSIDYVFAAVHRASNPLGAKSDFEQILSTTCALVRKYYKQKKEEYQMAIERDRRERDYLYGRLLGVADKLESYALRKANADRPTNAIRFMSAFSQRPYTIWATLHKSLTPYIQQLGSRAKLYRDEIEEISGKFLNGGYENNTSLEPSYLLGYYHERAEIDRMIHERSNKKTKEEKSDERANQQN